jgi:hypothetical protein
MTCDMNVNPRRQSQQSPGTVPCTIANIETVSNILRLLSHAGDERRIGLRNLYRVSDCVRVQVKLALVHNLHPIEVDLSHD